MRRRGHSVTEKAYRADSTALARIPMLQRETGGPVSNIERGCSGPGQSTHLVVLHAHVQHAILCSNTSRARARVGCCAYARCSGNPAGRLHAGSHRDCPRGPDGESSTPHRFRRSRRRAFRHRVGFGVRMRWLRSITTRYVPLLIPSRISTWTNEDLEERSSIVNASCCSRWRGAHTCSGTCDQRVSTRAPYIVCVCAFN